jgi:predicted permease
MDWLRKPPLDQEVAEELDFHVEMRTREYIASGMTPREARERALTRFGNLERVSRTCQDIGGRRDTEMRRREYFSELRQDATFAIRQLAAYPGFTLIAMLTLALGIGATTAIFGAVHAVVLRPLPVHDPGKLLFVTETWRGRPSEVSAGNFTDMMAEQGVFERATAVQYASFNLSTDENPERIIGARVSDGFFDVFGVAPSIGRVFRRDEDQPGSELVVMLSHRLWVRRFGADSSIVGKPIRLGGQPYTVVGVMPPHFDLTSDSEELWVPIAFTPERQAMHDEHYLTVVARPKTGVTQAQIDDQLKTIGESLKKRFPRDNAELAFQTRPFAELFVGDTRNRLFVLLGAVGLVLLIACSNVANLLLARGASRGRELAIRAALGAGRGRIVRQLITENAVLALVAGMAGLALAWWGIRSLLAIAPPRIPRLDQTAINGTVLAFALGVSVVSSILFGLAPALRAARAGVSERLKEGGRGQAGPGHRDWLRSTLIVSEVALAVLLLVGAGLLIRSAVELQRVRPGFDPAGVLTARVSLPASEYRSGRDRAVATFERVVEETNRVPGVTAAAVASHVPMAQGGNGNGLIPEGKPFDMKYMVQARLRMITPDFFDALRVPVLRGRVFDSRDRRGAQKVMIVSETLGAALFPGQDPLGRAGGAAASRLLPADPAGTRRGVGLGAAIDVRDRADRRRSRRAHPIAQEGHGRHRPGRPALQHQDARRADGRLPGRRALQHGAADAARRDRPRAVGDRHLRGRGVLRDAAHARDRRPDGARCDAVRRRAARPEPGRRAGRHGPRNRRHRVPRRDARALIAARRDRTARSADAPRRCARAWCDGASRGGRSGPPRRRRRSNAGAAADLAPRR